MPIMFEQSTLLPMRLWRAAMATALAAAALAVVPSAALAQAGAAQAVTWRPLTEPQGHCRAGEVALFDCPVGGKRLSVCASTDYSQRAGSLHYRYGPVGAAEIELPKDRWKGSATESRYETFPNGSSFGYLRFHNGPTGYVVFHGNVRAGRDGWEQRAGVAIELPRRPKPQTLFCSGSNPELSSLLDGNTMQRRLGFMENSEARPFDFP